MLTFLQRWLFPLSDDIGFLVTLTGLIGAGVLCFALVLQYGYNVHPCSLCLAQRWPWGIVMAGSIAQGMLHKKPDLRLIAYVLVMVALLAGTILSGYHHGVEQHWWQNVVECSTGLPDAHDLAAFRAAMLARPVIACDQIAWQFLGLSMASWNFILSISLAAMMAGSLWDRVWPYCHGIMTRLLARPRP